MAEPYETISLYKDKRAFASKKEGGHLTGDFDILSDKVDSEGNRIITLKPHDLSEHKRKLAKLVELLVHELDPKSKLLPKLLLDTLIDFPEDAIARMLNKVEKGKEKVTATEGCFKIYIGDGRRKSSEEIMVRS